MPVVFGEGAVAALWAAALLTILLWAVCLGLRFAWMRTFGAALYWLGDQLKIDVSIVHWHPGNYFKRASNAVANALEDAAVKCEKTAGGLFHGAASVQAWIAHEVAALAADTLHALTWLQRSHLPRWTKALIYAAFPPFLVARLVKAALHAQLPHLAKTVVIHTTQTIYRTVVKAAHATTGAVLQPGWVIRLPGRVGRIERGLPRIRLRLSRLEKLLSAGAAVALFTAAVAKLGLQWIRCRNVSKVGKGVCGMDTSLLEELLADGLIIVGAISVVEFAKGLLAIEGEAVKILGAGIREFPRT